jgi:hypothetical protein
MRTSTAYFAGAGTVVAAVVAGLGGGLLVANIVNPGSPKHGTEMTKLEQRMSSQPVQVQPVQALAAPSEPVSYLAATQASAPNPVVAASPTQQTPPQTDPANTTQAAAQPAEAVAARDAAASAQPPAPTAPSVAREQAASSEDSFVKAREIDLKRATAEKRHAERRQQWADKRRVRHRQDHELRDVEQKVREDTEPTQAFAAEPVKLEMPRIRLFDPE